MLKAKLDQQAGLLNKALAENRALNEAEQAQNDVLEKDIKDLEKTIELQNKLDERDAAAKAPVNEPLFAEPRNDTNLKLFKNLGEQLKAVKKVATDGVVDERLIKLNKQNRIKNAMPLGGNENIDSEGGFAIEEDFAGMMMNSAATSGNILPLVDQYQVSANSNSVEWTDIDESSVATSVFGGVQVYWAGEGLGVTATQPKLREVEVKLQKLMGIAYATYELENDSNFASQLYTKAFTLAIQRELEACIIGGTGVGKPLGFLQSPALVTVTKETGQVASTVVWENLSKMYNRALNKQKSIWIVNPDVHEQLDFLSFPVGVGGVPVYLQASSVGALDTLKGRPVIDSDHCPALGSAGDVNFVDLSEYFLALKGGLQSDTSMHVQFLTAQNCFRFIFRANGLPKRHSALTIKNSTNKRSPYVTLGART